MFVGARSWESCIPKQLEGPPSFEFMLDPAAVTEAESESDVEDDA